VPNPDPVLIPAPIWPGGGATGPEPAPPTVTINRMGHGMRARLTVSCAAACRGTAKITVDRRTARRAGTGRRRTIGRAVLGMSAAGRKTFRLGLSPDARGAVRRAKLGSLRATLSVTVGDEAGRARTARRTVRLVL
jgi:hypothetical protein